MSEPTEPVDISLRFVIECRINEVPEQRMSYDRVEEVKTLYVNFLCDGENVISLVMPVSQHDELARTIQRKWVDYLSGHLREILVESLSRLLTEAQVFRMNEIISGLGSLTTSNFDRLPGFEEKGEDEREDELRDAKKTVTEVLYRLNKRTLEEQQQKEAGRIRRRVRMKPRGGSDAEWTPERRAEFLKIYEGALQKVKSRSPELPPDVIEKLSLRGNKPSDIALEYAAQLFNVSLSDYLPRVLTTARRERARAVDNESSD